MHATIVAAQTRRVRGRTGNNIEFGGGREAGRGGLLLLLLQGGKTRVQKKRREQVEACTRFGQRNETLTGTEILTNIEHYCPQDVHCVLSIDRRPRKAFPPPFAEREVRRVRTICLQFWFGRVKVLSLLFSNIDRPGV